MNRLREIAEETVAIISSGGHQTTAGVIVRVAADLARAVADTRLCLPEDPLPEAAGRLRR